MASIAGTLFGCAVSERSNCTIDFGSEKSGGRSRASLALLQMMNPIRRSKERNVDLTC